MTDMCATCGLSSDLCVCDTIAKESQRIIVKLEKKKFGKAYTVIEGINEHEVDTKSLAKKLKNKFACGGTAKKGIIELQGDHRRKVKEELMKQGFLAETIHVK
ncbi:MAG: translation initiation factor [Candidatus Woesearchaeota archaeon]|nr:translation initiation factor [Candidatus Woesearchaeota archaeon]